MAEVKASCDTKSTDMILIFTDGTEIVVREEDFPCSTENPDKLYE